MSLTLIIDYIGYYAPMLLLFISVVFLSNRCTYLKFFIYGYAGTFILNMVLKQLIQEPRPSKDMKTLEIAIKNGQRIGFDKFGMPSGHAQTCGFCLAFMAMVFKSPYITMLYTIISIITMYQRYKYKNHTIMQLIIGFFIGIVTGLFVYLASYKTIKGVLKMKPDDNAPL